MRRGSGEGDCEGGKNTRRGGVELCFQKRFFLTKNSTVLRIQSLMEFRL